MSQEPGSLWLRLWLWRLSKSITNHQSTDIFRAPVGSWISWINDSQARAKHLIFLLNVMHLTHMVTLHPTRVNNLFKKNWWWLKSNDRIWPLIDISWDKQWFKRSLRIFVVMSVFFSSPSSSPSSSPRDVHNFCKWWLSEEGGTSFLSPLSYLEQTH